jgi:hypothetical protein
MIREYKNFVEPDARFQTLFLMFEETEFWKLMWMLCARLGVGEFRVQTDPVEPELYCQATRTDLLGANSSM